tara:strand:+ start:5190 stop:6353 length:1164 start_codon:yes stop_codon:yes gene_type:complete
MASLNIAKSALLATAGTFLRSVANSPTVTKAAPSANASIFAATEMGGGRNSTSNLSYPLNVAEDPQQGHYISFYIRQIESGKMEAIKKARKVIADRDQILKSSGVGGGGIIEAQGEDYVEALKTLSDAKKASAGVTTGSGKGGSKIVSTSLRMKKFPTKHMPGVISLYMPPSVQVSYESKYNDTEIGVLAHTGSEILDIFMRGGGDQKSTIDKLTATVEHLGAGGEEMLRNLALASLDVAAPGAKAIFAIERGKVITPKMELMFEGIGRRNFSFTFTFIPKSVTEAQVVKDIIFKFKYHMAANFEGTDIQGSRTMKFPDTFDIEYMHMSSPNVNLNKIATCALTKMDVEYGGDRYVAYDGGVPQTTKLTLNFTETEIITRDHIADGF